MADLTVVRAEVIRAHHPNDSLVLTTGHFDIIDSDVISRFGQLKSLGSISVIGLWPDCLVENLIHSLEDRRQVIEAMPDVDYVLTMPDKPTRLESAKAVLDVLHPNFFL